MNADEAFQLENEQQDLEETPMGIIAKKEESNYTPAPEGTHVAVCTMMVDLGMQVTVWNGEEKAQHKVYLGFSLVNEPLEYEKDGEKISTLMVVGSMYTLSLHEKAVLRQHLEAWRGKKFSSDEESGFDVTAVLGAPCMITIVHNQKGDKTYANIAGISSLVKGMEKPNFTGDLICYHAGDKSQQDKLPRWIKSKLGIEQSEDGSSEAPATNFDDDIPF